ncbi:MAG: amino acid adenylation domain-containing protein [Burkholderiales bacterium]|nr:amino acid adenylation domain-containing protein [Burkholderiales bacterium]
MSTASQSEQKALFAQTPILYGPEQDSLLRQECLADILESTATKFPDRLALASDHVSLSYAELGARADLFAHYLIQAGVKAGDIVGLWMPRGIDALVAQAGIAKSGAAWLPFDADVPVERIAVCLDDARAVGIVTSAEFATQLTDLPQTLFVSEQMSAPVTGALSRRQPVQGSDPAYVIYTSGSTGKPKGILITQASICHFLRSENSVLGIRETDRVYQGFSLAFDMSFEEIWISYLVGASLWIAPKEVALDPDALPRALIAQNVTVLHAVPTLLALFSVDVPSLRLINLGGEMCPASLVDRWVRDDRQMFNTYGPTEATVSASLARLHANEEVTIGEPLPNYGLLVIDPDVSAGLRLLARGELGELCIFGPGVSAGYLGRPDLTAEKFLDNPWASIEDERRLYRTGDLARISEEGMVQCLGRADDQIKIRGFRVELGEIEAVLAQQAGVGTVAVLLRSEQGIDQLVAFVVKESGPDGEALTAQHCRQSLAHSLPAYMVPSRYEFLDEMPRLSSGKIDRKTLKSRELAEQVASAENDSAQTEAEQVLFASLTALFPGQAIRRDADFFSDLGGHSLMAARLVSSLRQDARFAYFKIGDIYQHRLLGKIAEAMQAGMVRPTSALEEEPWSPPSAWKRWTCALAQATMIPCLVAFRMLQWLTPFFAYHFFTGDSDDSIPRAVALSLLCFLLVTVAEFLLAIAAKWLILGRVRAGAYPLWGAYYFRWWLVDRIVEAAPVYMLSGSPMYAWWLRALGARIGKDVIIGSMTLRVPDLLSIERGASVGNACNFENARVERGVLHLGSIDLGEHTCVGSYALLEGGTRLHAYAHLAGQSVLVDGQEIPAYRCWSGSPALDTGAFDPASLPPRPQSGRLRQIAESLFYVLGSLTITALFFLPVFPTFILIDWLDTLELLPNTQNAEVSRQLSEYFIFAFPATAVLIVCTALLSAGIRWGLLPKLVPGRYAVHSNVYCGKWLVNQIQECSLQVLHGVYATIYSPFWYRLLGAKIGKETEVSTALGVVPDMLTLGDECFIADAVMLGDEEIDQGWMSVQATVVERRSFIGNGAYIPDGTHIPENVLIGVHTSAPENSKMQSGQTWIGSPAMHLPAREELQGFPEHLTFKPKFWRRCARGLIEAFRIIAPHALVIAIGYTIVLDLMPLAAEERWLEVVYYLGISGLLYGAGCFVFVLAAKWLFIFKYKKSSHPMWTRFVWFSEAVTNLYEGIAVPNFMRYLKGTPWLPLAFNLLGARIAKGVYLDTTDITEFDCVTIGAYSEINAAACPQTHLFEDRVMKIDHVVIGEKVVMGARSFVLYGAEIGDGAQLGALTLVMKAEFIPSDSHWRGCPAAIA